MLPATRCSPSSKISEIIPIAGPAQPMAARGSRSHRWHNAHIGIIAVDDDGAELEDGLGAVGGPSGACNPESVFDDVPAGSLDHAGGDGPAAGEGLVVFHVLLVVGEVGDGPVDVGEVEAALAGVGAGFRGDGGEGGGDGFRAAVQDAQELPVGPLPGRGGVAGVQGGGGLADVAADVDVIDEDWSPGNFVDISIMLLLVPNCQIGARNPLGLSCRADAVSGRDCNIARCSRTRRS